MRFLLGCGPERAPAGTTGPTNNTYLFGQKTIAGSVERGYEHRLAACLPAVEFQQNDVARCRAIRVPLRQQRP
jgi:hypothetical protein